MRGWGLGVATSVAAGVAVVAAALAGCSSGAPAPRVTHTVTVAPAATPTASAQTRAPQQLAVAAKPVPKSRPKPNHCAHNSAGQKVIVSLAAQHMWWCAAQRTVYDNAITSGMVGQYTETPTGDYVIQDRVRDTVLTLNTGAQYKVRYWIPFDGPLFGFHDASWQTFPYGSPKYKTDGSHGCIHMPLRAIAHLYTWAQRPTAVHIS